MSLPSWDRLPYPADRSAEKLDLYLRRDAVKALAQMKPLSPEAVRALTLVLKDESLDLRSEAATALQDVGGEAEQAALAEQKREDQIYAQAVKPDTRRYSKEELSAKIPADGDHKYPLTLAYLFPISRSGSAQQAKLLITLHSGRDRPERLVFWKEVGDDQYQKAKVIESDDPGLPEDFETPTCFSRRGRCPAEGVLFRYRSDRNGYRATHPRRAPAPSGKNTFGVSKSFG